MNEQETEVARGFVACKGFRWLPGMLSSCGIRISDAADGKHFLYPHGIRAGDWRARPHVGPPLFDSVPNINDPAFPGLALFLVREAWKDPYIFVVYLKDLGVWSVNSPMTVGQTGRIACRGTTEVGALLEALRALP